MRKLASYILLAILFWTLPALAINMGQQTAPGVAETAKTISTPSQNNETTSPTQSATVLLLGAGLIGLVAFSRNRAKE
jgi:hypothetical protein